MDSNTDKLCTLCRASSDDVKHLPLYVIGSEGCEACLTCRLVLTGVASGLMQVAAKARRNGYLSAKRVAEAKQEQAEAIDGAPC